MITLSTLPKIVKKSKRIGRGGKYGKNAGYGNKGQKKRAGKMRVGFEGGQKSLVRRTPKFKGYKFSLFQRDLEVLNISHLANIVSADEVVNLALLKEKNIVSDKIKRVRVIKNKDVEVKFTFDTKDESIYLTKGVHALLK